MATKRDLFNPECNEWDAVEEDFEPEPTEGEYVLFTPEAEEQIRIQFEIDEFLYSFNSKKIFNN